MPKQLDPRLPKELGDRRRLQGCNRFTTTLYHLIKRISMKSLRVLFFAPVAALVLTASAYAADPSGTWKWSMPGRNGETSEATLKLELKDGKLTGTLSGRRGDAPISDASFTDDHVKFSVVRERNDQKWVTKYDGKLEGDAIKGTVEMPGRDGGEARKSEWVAHKG